MMSVGFLAPGTLKSSGADLVMENGGIADPPPSPSSSHLKIQHGSVISFVINNIHRMLPNRPSFHASVWASCATGHMGLV